MGIALCELLALLRAYLRNEFRRDTVRAGDGRQAEAGIKADLLNRRLSATLAVYELRRQNVTTADPDNPGFSIQTCEQRARGIELDLAGDLSPAWKLLGSAAYTDATLTKDNTVTPGNRIQGCRGSPAACG